MCCEPFPIQLVRGNLSCYEAHKESFNEIVCYRNIEGAFFNFFRKTPLLFHGCCNAEDRETLMWKRGITCWPDRRVLMTQTEPLHNV